MRDDGGVMNEGNVADETRSLVADASPIPPRKNFTLPFTSGRERRGFEMQIAEDERDVWKLRGPRENIESNGAELEKIRGDERFADFVGDANGVRFVASAKFPLSSVAREFAFN